MPDQLPIFGFHDTRPKLRMKKVVSKSRVEEVRKMLEAGDQVSAMKLINEGLEDFDRRLSNGKK